MKKLLNFLKLGTFAVLLLATTTVTNAQQASGINASTQLHDFGDIIQSEGPVSTTVQISNNSDQKLEINRLSTSCGCTTATMDLSDLQPGETRDMKITFDPMTHPDQFGAITRVVYLQTSDPNLPELEIEIKGNVIGEANINKAPPVSDKTPQTTSDKQVIVFFNEACQDCGELVKEFYPQFFSEYGYELVQRDYINERENRQILNELNEQWGIPFELQSHIEAFVDDKLMIGGHVPESIMRYLIENPDKYDKLLVYQDKMHGEGTDYKVWDFQGEIKTYPLDEPITTYFSEESGDSSTIKSNTGFWGLFGVITTSAFLDGINPCAIAVLLFFIAFLFTMKETRRSIWKMGLTYIAAIYLAYFLIGIGIAQAIIITSAPHLMAYIGAYLVIALGLIQILNLLIPSFPIKLRIPINTKSVIEKWLNKATIPAAFIGGFVVGLCTFPCSGGIYVAIIGMLASSQTYTSGLGWMIWYNLMFILPLIMILIMAGNPLATEKLQKLERKQSKLSKLIIGLTMIALGVIIILFFT